MNFRTTDNFGHDRSNIAEYQREQAQALSATIVPLRSQTITIDREDIEEAIATFKDAYEHLDDRGLTADLPLTDVEIMDVFVHRLGVLCEEFMDDIRDNATRDRVLKMLIDHKVARKLVA